MPVTKTRLAQLIARGTAQKQAGWPLSKAKWSELEEQLQFFAMRGLSLRNMTLIYAPSNEDDAKMYLLTLCDALGCSPDDSVRTALRIPAQ